MKLNPKNPKYVYLLTIILLGIIFFLATIYNKNITNKISSITANIKESLNNVVITKNNSFASNVIASDRLYDAIDIKDDILIGSDIFKTKISSNEIYIEFAKIDIDGINDDNTNKEVPERSFWIKTNIKNAIKKPADIIDREAITYGNIFPGIDIKQYAYNNKVKEEFIVHEKQYLKPIIYKIEYSENMTLALKDNKILFYEKNTDQIIAETQKPFAIDTKGNKYDLIIKKNNNDIILDYPENINNASFPLTIDPTYIVYNGSANIRGSRSLARDSQNNLYTVYHRTYNDQTNIMIAKSANQGQTWSEQIITEESQYAQRDPSIAIDSNDNIHIAWYGQHSGSTSYNQIRYMKYNGSSWSSIENLTSGNYNQNNPSIIIDSNNNIHITWIHSASPNFIIKYIKHNGTSWSSVTNLKTENYIQFIPSIAIDSNDNIHIAWYGRHSGSTSYNQIRYMKYNGSSWSSVANLTNGNYHQNALSIAIDSNDNIHIAWYGQHSGSTSYNQIRYIKYNGSSWSSIENLTSGNYNQFIPSIAIDSNDNIHIAWYGQHSGSTTYHQIRYMKYNGSSWSSIENLTNEDNIQTYPCLIYANYPIVNNIKTNIPKNGFALTWGNADSINYYASSDLEWQSDITKIPPSTPSNIYPENQMENIDINPNISSSEYLHTENIDHKITQWQIDNDNNFSSPVWERISNSAEISTIINSDNGNFANELSGQTHLDYETIYYIRVRYKDINDNWSEYSNYTEFTTKLPDPVIEILTENETRFKIITKPTLELKVNDPINRTLVARIRYIKNSSENCSNIDMSQGTILDSYTNPTGWSQGGIYNNTDNDVNISYNFPYELEKNTWYCYQISAKPIYISSNNKNNFVFKLINLFTDKTYADDWTDWTEPLSFESGTDSFLTNISDTISREKISQYSDHTIKFTTPSGVLESNKAIAITFPSDFDTTNVDYTDIELSYGPVTGLENSLELSSFPDNNNWGAIFNGQNNRTLALVHPTNDDNGDIPENSIIIVKIGNHTINGNNQIKNPTTSGNKIIFIGGSFGDYGEFSIPIIGDDQVLVTGTVDPSISFSLSHNYAYFGSINLSKVKYATSETVGSQTPPSEGSFSISQIATNAANGLNISAQSYGNGTNAGLYSQSISNLIEAKSISEVQAMGSNGYAFAVKDATASIGTLNIADGFLAESGTESISKIPKNFAYSNEPISNGSIKIDLKLTVSGLTPAGTYNDTLTIICTGNY